MTQKIVGMADTENAIQQVHDWCVEKGWRGEGVPARPAMDELALILSEASEAFEAYRTWGFGRVERHPNGSDYELREGDDYGTACKPEGVGSELADVVIRLYDFAYEVGKTEFHVLQSIQPIESTSEYFMLMARVAADASRFVYTWGEPHDAVEGEFVKSQLSSQMDFMFTLTLQHAGANMINLAAEYEAKFKYNYTRTFRHGGKLL